MLGNLVELALEMRWSDALDITTVALLLWVGMESLSTPRARAAGGGMFALLCLFVVARQLELELTLWLLQGLTALALVTIVVVFQDEIRQLFSRLPRLRPFAHRAISSDLPEWLPDTVAELAGQRTGALIVLAGADDVENLAVRGVRLDGVASRPLLLSLFDPSSPGHDGAVLLDRGRVTRFGTHLPLADDARALNDRGTRHAAALGLSERCDALVLVVSEETGCVSVAREGSLVRLAAPADCAPVLAEFLQVTARSPARGAERRRLLARVGVEPLAAIAVALGLWVGFAPAATVTEIRHPVPVVVQNVPPGFELTGVAPDVVEVTFAGPRRTLLVFETEGLTFTIDATLVRFGRRQFSLNPALLLLPSDVSVVRMSPEQVTLTTRPLELAPPERQP